MAKKGLKTPDNNNGVRRSTRVKYFVQRLTYDGFVAHHYAYMVELYRTLNPLILNKLLETLNGTMPWMKRWRLWMLMLLGNW
jgi:hypothetical protein